MDVLAQAITELREEHQHVCEIFGFGTAGRCTEWSAQAVFDAGSADRDTAPSSASSRERD